ncbi:MAG: ParM/StbA family protein [Clostridiales bacterium]|nr:ParM/StbA family protein [Clostridiales bacterium]
MIKIGLDIGYGNTKIITDRGSKICFPSLAKQGEKLNLDKMLSAAGDYVATINGTTWFIGDMAEKEHKFAVRAFDDNMRYNNPAFQAMLATAIAIVSEPDEKIVLVTGLPLAAYIQSQKNFENFLLDFTAEVEINGETKNIKLSNVYVFPQAAGIFLNPACDKYKQSLAAGDVVTIIDIGYRTTDVASFQYSGEVFELIMENSFTYDNGMVSVFRDVANKMSADLNMFDVSLESAERTYLTGKCSNGKDYTEINDNIASKFVKSLADEYRKRGPGKDQTKMVLLAGGGSLALHSNLSQSFSGANFVPDAQFANAAGFLDVAQTLSIALF